MAKRCKHPSARAVVCMVRNPQGAGDVPIQNFRTDGYTVRWCPDCGSLRAKHPKRFGLETRVQWRRPRDVRESEARVRRQNEYLDALIEGRERRKIGGARV
jgi:rRNA maturation protein Nop10